MSDMPAALVCPFKVGDRIHELRWAPFPQPHSDRAFGAAELDPTKPDATVTAVTERGFTYRYDQPIPFGRAADGFVVHGGTCYPEGYWLWRQIEVDSITITAVIGHAPLG